VMGLDVVPDEPGYWWCPQCQEWVHGQQVSYSEIHDRCGEPVAHDWPCDRDGNVHPKFSTDIAAAWQVVEKMRDTLGHWELAHHILDPRKCYAEFGGEYEPYDGWHNCKGCALADTAPLAICRAALLATLEQR